MKRTTLQLMIGATAVGCALLTSACSSSAARDAATSPIVHASQPGNPSAAGSTSSTGTAAQPGTTAPAAGSTTPTGGAVEVSGVHPSPVPTTLAALIAFVHAGTPAAPSGFLDSRYAPNSPLSHATDGTVTFQSPSGNITCSLSAPAKYDTAQTVCQINALNRPTPRPNTCNQNWLPGVVELVGTTATIGACAGNPILPVEANHLPYGSTVTRSGTTGEACRSDAAFVACIGPNAKTGVVLSRAQLRTYH